MEFFKDVKRATAKTNIYINDNGGSLIDLLLLLVTPLVAIDVLRQFFDAAGYVWIAMSFLYICVFMLIPTLWLRSTVESEDPERDFVSYLGSSKTYMTNLILILITIIFIKIPEIAGMIDKALLDTSGVVFAHTALVTFVIFSLACLRLSFLIPLYNSGLNLTYSQALQATRGKAAILAATIISSAFPLILFTVIYAFFITPWLVENVFDNISRNMITMILIAPAKYLAAPLIMIYSFTALAYHYANYAKQYLVMHKDGTKAPPKKKDMH
ncbi:MAG: hypothetical protein NZ828_09485 [Alphaproteobacteria bacterium]|nr:hypothetical protein [Alphaproteobacteria bacterium]